MFVNADDKGFCDETELIIEILENAENNLLEENYKSALTELCDKGLLFKFNGNHGNSVYLIRHWYFHNMYKSNLKTDYYKYLKQVILEDNKYEWKKEETIIKEENKLNINEIKVNEIKETENGLNPSDYPFDV